MMTTIACYFQFVRPAPRVSFAKGAWALATTFFLESLADAISTVGPADFNVDLLCDWL